MIMYDNHIQTKHSVVLDYINHLFNVVLDFIHDPLLVPLCLVLVNLTCVVVIRLVVVLVSDFCVIDEVTVLVDLRVIGDLVDVVGVIVDLLYRLGVIVLVVVLVVEVSGV